MSIFPPAPAIGMVREDGRVLREFSIRIPFDGTIRDGFLERWVRWARSQGYEVVEARAFVQPSDYWALCVTTAVWLYPDDDRNPLGLSSRDKEQNAEVHQPDPGLHRGHVRAGAGAGRTGHPI